MTVVNNYFTRIYSAFIDYPTGLALNTKFSFLMAGLALAVTLLMMLFWVYISLRIDKKRYDIMIWFLDIPIPYVSHLGAHCDLYLKHYTTIQELTQKGIPTDDDDDIFD